MNIKTKEIYSEVYQVLNLLGEEYIEKLPNSLVDMLREKRDINYNPQYRDDLPFSEQNMRKETISIIALLYLNYWCENQQKKLKLTQILKENEDKYQEELINKYSPDNIFQKYNENKELEDKQNNVQMIKYKEPIFKKIFNKIKNSILGIFSKN